ncbi:MAG: patatin-like phospholipase family protein, partial [Candidatus Omnitrophica bacterium]|nr:patatin-like phospholipase family protein [Candidatus Omnitrophota bacterium]
MIGLIKKDQILQEIPLFAGLSSQHRSLIQEKVSFKEYKRDEIIYREGAPAGALYVVVLGRVVIFTQDERGKETILEYLHRGKYFGIISLLTGEPHSVTARAVNDCLLLTIEKPDFDFILKLIPQLAIDLSQTLSRRLKRKDIHQKTIFESISISIFSSYSQAGKSVYALNLALSLIKEAHKSVIILDIAPSDKIHSLPRRLEIAGDYRILDLSSSQADSVKAIKDFILKDKLGIGLLPLSYNPEDELFVKRLAHVSSLLANDYHYIILDLPSDMDRNILDTLNQSDLIHILTSPEPVDLERTSHLIGRLKAEFNFQEEKIKVIINEYKASRLTYQEQVRLLGHSIFATLPRIEFKATDKMVLDDPDSEYAKAIRRIARKVSDSLVGLALGVGVAYGFCHIGVLKVIEEENIPIDVISGSSIGALIASLWVTGRTSNEILEITTAEFRKPKYIWGLIDLTLPFLGFIKGNKLYKFLKKYLGSKTFYDVKLPLKIIASDVKRKEPIILEKGLLIDAIMASCTMPGVFAPFKFKQSLLFDGGVINPLPTEPLFKMGVKKIIAVNVTPSREDLLNQYEKIKEAGTVANHYQNKIKTNILDIIFSSVE